MLLSAKLCLNMLLQCFLKCTQWPIQLPGRGGGGRCTEVVIYSLVERSYQTCSDVIRIVFSLQMSPSLGGLGRPPAVRWKLAKTPWGRGLMLLPVVAAASLVTENRQKYMFIQFGVSIFKWSVDGMLDNSVCLSCSLIVANTITGDPN